MTDAYDDERRAQMFPVLTDAQVARAELHATRRSLAAGETTFELGTADPGIHIVLSGALEVIGPWAAGDDLVTVLSAGQFNGEVSSLSGRLTLVRGRMREAGEVLRLDGSSLRQVIQEDSNLSEVLMRTFILRRVALLSRGFSDCLEASAMRPWSERRTPQEPCTCRSSSRTPIHLRRRGRGHRRPGSPRALSGRRQRRPRRDLSR